MLNFSGIFTINQNNALDYFSFYLSGRNNIILSIGDEILALLDQGFSGKTLNKNGTIQRAETLMWLWILGAYEVTRTMCQAKKCFSNTYYNKLLSLKQQLAQARMPAAKMEKAGKPKPVSSNRSPAGWDLKNKDLLVNDPEEQNISARVLISQYKRTLLELNNGDIVKRHEESYK